MKTKISAFILLSVLLICVLAGCTSEKDTNTTTTPETTVTVTEAVVTTSTTAEDSTNNTNEPATVYATFAKDIDIDLTNAQRFTVDNSDYETEIVFTANESVKSFSFCSLSWLYNEDLDESDFEFVPMFTTDNFDEPVVVTMTFWGDVPSYGILFTDADGTEHSATISTSGMDGSLILDVI